MNNCFNCGAPLKDGKCLNCGTEERQRSGRVLVTNCPNCGAALKDGKCLYCGTEVRLANEIDIDFRGKPIELMLNITQGDTVTLLPLVGRIDTIETRTERASYDTYAGFPLRVRGCTEVQFTFSGIIKER